MIRIVVVFVFIISMMKIGHTQNVTNVDIGDGAEYLSSAVCIDDTIYSAGHVLYPDGRKNGLLVKYSNNNIIECKEVICEDKFLSYRAIKKIDGRLFVTGSYQDVESENSNTFCIGELTTGFESLWEKSYTTGDSIQSYYGEELLFIDDEIIVAGGVHTGYANYAILMKFDLEGDSLIFKTYSRHSYIHDVIFNYDSMSLVLAGDRITTIQNAQIVKVDFDFNIVDYHYIETAGRRSQSSITLIQESDSTTILGCQDNEHIMYGYTMGTESDLRINRLDENYMLYGEMAGIGSLYNRDYPAPSHCIDFNTSDTIYFCLSQFNHIPIPPTQPSDLWIGYLNRDFFTHQIYVLSDENYFYNPREIISLTHGGCVVVGNSWNLANEPSTVQGLIVELSPEDIISTTYRTLFQSEEIVPIPNPVDQNFQFRNPEGKLIDILIYNSSGKVVYQTQSNDTYVYVSSGVWESGVYVYRVLNENDLIGSGKIVKI